MEISVINRISDFEAGISSLNRLNNPSFSSKVFAVSGIEKIYPAYHFWKWGAFVLALLASLSTIINRLKTLIIRFRRKYHSLQPQPLLYGTDFDTDTDDGASSCSSSDDEGEYEEEEEEESSSRNWRRVDEDFRVKGSGHVVDDQLRNGRFTLRRRRTSIGDLFSWAEELAAGKSVVKLWDNLGLGFGLEHDDSDDVLNIYDVNKETKIGSLFGGKSDFQAVAASSSSSPSVVVSAGADSSARRVSVSAWDTRLPCRKPAILREWSPEKPMEKISSVKADGSVEKVYFRGDVTGNLTVGDMRKAGSPLRNLTDSDVDTWWDADAVIVSDESID